jgi:hypothetical protein
MKNPLGRTAASGEGIADALKNWVMVALSVIFTLLYVAALTGFLKPLNGEKIVAHLEPIIFIIIGYFFGRLPGQQNEKTLKEEIGRQAHKAAAAQDALEQSQQIRESLEEKIKNVRTALASSASAETAKGLAGRSDKTDVPVGESELRQAAKISLNILDS